MTERSGSNEPGGVAEPSPADLDAGRRLAVLIAIMRQLRSPEGCPWDREQDFRSLRRYTIEEAYEVVQAIDDGDRRELAGELGDLLLQVVFLSQLGAEEGSFSIDDAIRSIVDKLVRRHPHVFGEIAVDGAEEVKRNWEQIKRGERGAEPGSLVDDVPHSLPALERAQKLGKRAAQLRFDWPDVAAVLPKVREELAELEEAIAGGSGRRVEEELGDLLFALTSVARHTGVSAEVALVSAGAKFERRFREVEDAVARGRVDASPAAMEEEWQRIKRRESAAEDRRDADADQVENQQRDGDE
jgi:MazG family protein